MKKLTRKHLPSFLEKYATDEIVLDIGAGYVETNHSYSKYFPNRHTVDIDPARQPDTVADVQELPFEDNSYDFILCTEVLEHCHAPQKAIDEMHRVLKPGGSLVLTTRFVYPLHDVPHDYFRFTKYGLRELFKLWKIEELRAETETFSAIGALIQRTGFQTKLRGGRATKIIVYALAYFFDKCNGLILEEYGDINKGQVEENILTTGYYIICKK